MILTPEDEVRILEECEVGRGTPHRNRIAKPGVGVDCIKFVLLVMMRAGTIKGLKIPKYPVNVGRRGAEEILIKNIERHLHVERIDPTKARTGDFAIFEARLSCNHVGLVVGPDLWQVLTGAAAEPYPYKEWVKYMHVLLRLTRREAKPHHDTP